MLSLILADGALYADLEEPDMIKPPVVYVAGMLRQTGTYVTTDDWVWMLDQMGQRPFYPPNVSGWEQNEAWLSTGSLRMRFQAAAVAAPGRDQGRRRCRRSARPRRRSSARSPTPGSPGRARRRTRRSRPTAAAAWPGKDEKWEVKHYWPERERVLRHVLLAGPDAQVC